MHLVGRKSASCKQAMICYTRLNMTDPTPIDITNMPKLVKIAEEVEATKTPRELKRDNKTVAVLMPTTHVPGRKTDKTSVKEALALAGAWGERNWDEVEEEIICSSYWHLKATMLCPACGKENVWDFTTHFIGDVGSYMHEYMPGKDVDELKGVTVLLDGRIDALTGECPHCEALFDVGAEVVDGKVTRVFILRQVEVVATIINKLTT